MYQLTLAKEFNTPLEKLFVAWTTTDAMKQWFAPGDMTVPEASCDFRVGGTFRVVMQEPDGEQHIVSGEYQEIVNNEKLVFSWQWEGSPNVTKVSISFKSVNETCSSLTLEHSEFIEQEFSDKHKQGWIGCLLSLEKYIS